MAVLPDAERVTVWKRAIKTLTMGNTSALSKVEWRQLIDDADAWADANASAYNTAIRAAVRSKATLAEKAVALAIVCLQRAGLPLGGD